ncbi:MAG: hypothetical protein AVDCRST_MAG93-6311 [uncultured Chloroflexia bacterium]|uniref:Uncharacterized protein n=1 Tax=uncultured Chloroflexia bacterium TaxID=1672391 RepID=A0A6J4LI44_9CHLR|nr:MAG: hypothetical protein AVDCRST_MAG93-6311 [uncultured Chloroflexia bacterium]
MRSRPRLRRLLSWLFSLAFVVLVAPSLIGVLGVVFRCGVFGSAPAQTQRIDTEPPAVFAPIIAERSDAQRPEDQTYLTLPEWYIVYSADEYAAYVAQNPPSSFPYFRAIGQFWSNYYDVCAVTRERYSFNGGYNVIMVVIGASFTVENTVRGIYENTVGRVTEWISSGGDTAEDTYAQAVASEYGTFLHETPWYQFPFSERLSGLWSTTPGWGPNIIRKWERRFALTMEYGIKAGYGWLLGRGTQSAFSPQDLTIAVWVRGDERRLASEPAVTVLSRDGDNLLIAVPRYESFTQLVPRLAEDLTFIEIAGNRTILVTVLAPRAWQNEDENVTQLFSKPSLTERTRQRVALDVPVEQLSHLLLTLPPGVQFEHIYDY